MAIWQVLFVPFLPFSLKQQSLSSPEPSGPCDYCHNATVVNLPHLGIGLESIQLESITNHKTCLPVENIKLLLYIQRAFSLTDHNCHCPLLVTNYGQISRVWCHIPLGLTASWNMAPNPKYLPLFCEQAGGY